MGWVLDLYSRISLLGVNLNRENRIVSQNHQNINRTIFWISIITIFYCIFYYLFGLYALLITGFLFFSLWNLLYLLTKNGKFKLVRFLILLLGNLQITALNYFAGGDAGIYIFFIPASLAPFLFYSITEKKQIIYFAIFSSTLLLICMYFKEMSISYYKIFDIRFHLILYVLSVLSSIALSIFFISFLVYLKDIHATLEQRETTNSDNLLAALTESLTKTSKILDTTGEGYWFLQNTTIIEINTSLSILLERPRDEIIGKDISFFLDELGLEIFNSDLQKIIKEKKFSHELSLFKKDGTTVPCLLHSTFFEKDAEEKIEIFSFISDISEMKYFQKELVKSVKQADDATRAKSLFLASISHEIRTPMNSIIGLSELAIRNRKPEKTEDYLSKINRSANSLLKIINDLLDFSKVESGKMEMEFTPFSLSVLLDQLYHMIEYKIKEKNLAFELIYDINIPELINGDPTKVQQILLNLLQNSIKFTESGSITLKLHMEKEEPTSLLIQFSVEDTGIGLRPEEIQKLFKPFSQADSSTQRKYGGTGLGLSIIKKLLDLMNGSIRVESHVGFGSKFSFTIPFQKALNSFQKETIKSEKIQVNTLLNFDNFKNIHIMIVDDNEINREILKEQLSTLNISITEAIHGRECLDILSKNIDFNLILMDIQMPILDGIETTKLIKSDPELSSIPIITLSAHGFQEEIDKCKKIGVADFLVKPVNFEDLVASISRYIRLPEEKKDTAISPPKDNPFQVPEITGLDAKTGLRRMMGNQSAYIELLKKFFTNQSGTSERMQIHFANQDMDSLQRDFHSLLGVSSNLGMTGISSIAMSLETNLRKKELDSLPENLKQLQSALNQMLKDLDSFFQMSA
jgi:PAS domain S-box-containing protein